LQPSWITTLSPKQKVNGYPCPFLDMQANCLAQVDPIRTTGRGQHIKNMTCCYHLLPSSFSHESLITWNAWTTWHQFNKSSLWASLPLVNVTTVLILYNCMYLYI
jgi:hypothetical protein